MSSELSSPMLNHIYTHGWQSSCPSACWHVLPQVLVMETCSGLVAGAVAERMGGHGTVCATWAGSRAPPLDVVRMFNFEAAVRDTVCSASLGSLEAAAAQVAAAAQAAAAAAAALAPAGVEAVSGDAEAVQEQRVSDAVAEAGSAAIKSMAEPSVALAQPLSAASPPADVEMAEAAEAAPSKDTAAHAYAGSCGSVPPAVAAALGSELADGAAAAPSAQPSSNPAASAAAAGEVATTAAREAQGRSLAQASRPVSRNGRAAAPAAAPEQLQAVLQRGGFNCCIVAAPTVAPLAAIQRLLPLLAPSASFVLFSNFLQPLTDAMHALQASKAAVNMQLQVPAKPYRSSHVVERKRCHVLVLSGLIAVGCSSASA